MFECFVMKNNSEKTFVINGNFFFCKIKFTDYPDVETTFTESKMSTSGQVRQHIYQQQCSGNSNASNQSVFHQTNGNAHQQVCSTYGGCIQQPQNTSSGSYSNISTAPDDTLHIADVADLLHPQHAIITGFLIKFTSKI